MRVGRAADGTLVLGPGPGRGAWLCAEHRGGPPLTSCLEAAERRNGFSRAFRTPVPTGASGALRTTQQERERMDDAPAPGAASPRRD
ncbi:YlxR family protein [Acidiferrimicrobium sp. IK]|nr:YlxR family protein [Acidiferrimicrobium sp. IK]